MDSNQQLELLNDSRTQYHWAIANIVLALGCVALAALAFVAGYIVAGLLIIVVSFACSLTWTTRRYGARSNVWNVNCSKLTEVKT